MLWGTGDKTCPFLSLLPTPAPPQIKGLEYSILLNKLRDFSRHGPRVLSNQGTPTVRMERPLFADRTTEVRIAGVTGPGPALRTHLGTHACAHTQAMHAPALAHTAHTCPVARTHRLSLSGAHPSPAQRRPFCSHVGKDCPLVGVRPSAGLAP